MNSQTAVAGKAQITNLEAQLAPGEKVLWRGKPERGPFVTRTWPLSVFGLLLCTSVVIYEVVILTTEAPDWLALWGIPFAVAGLYMAVGHFLVTNREWQQTEYMITEGRVLIRHGIFNPNLTVYSVLSVPHVVIEMHGDNVGNLLFKPQQGQGYGPWPGYQNMWPYVPGYLVGLMYIRDPRHVEEILERARSG